MERAYAHCETLLHDHDKDRYLADLFIPAARRAHVHALHAFSFEIARIRELVSEPMPGELRHQWWRDVLANDARTAPSANPVAAALIDTIERFSLPRPPLIALIDARGFDLYDDPMPDMSTLETYCRETSSLLFRWVGEIWAEAARSLRHRLHMRLTEIVPTPPPHHLSSLPPPITPASPTPSPG